MPKRLAFLTVAVLHEPVGNPRMQGFLDRLPGLHAAADASDGFQARSVRDVATWKHSWGEVVTPGCYPKFDHPERYAMTLSLWDDIESIAAFSYNGEGAETLTTRKEWFKPLGLPTFVAWWVDENHRVNWNEAAERLDHLHTHGPSAFAFNFAEPFDADGNPSRLDRSVMETKARRNAAMATSSE